MHTCRDSSVDSVPYFFHDYHLFDVIFNNCITAARLHEFWIILGPGTSFPNSTLTKLTVYSVNFTFCYCCQHTFCLSKTVLFRFYRFSHAKKFMKFSVNYFFFSVIWFIWRYFQNLHVCRDSSVGRASDWRSEGPWFKSGELLRMSSE